MNIAPIGISTKPMGKLYADDDGYDAEDPTFAHLKAGTPEREILSEALKILVTLESVKGPLSEFKKIQDQLFSTQAGNLTKEDGTPSSTYK